MANEERLDWVDIFEYQPFESVGEFVEVFGRFAKAFPIKREEVRYRGTQKSFFTRRWQTKSYSFALRRDQYWLNGLAVRERNEASTQVTKISGIVEWSRARMFDVFSVHLDPSVHNWVTEERQGFRRRPSGLYVLDINIKKGEDLVLNRRVGQLLKDIYLVAEDRPREYGMKD